MKSLGEYMAKVREVAERAREHASTPEWEAALARLRAEDAAAEEHRRRMQLRALFHARGIPKIFWDEFARVEGTSSLESANRFAMEGPRMWILVLSGLRGTGKSFAAASILADMDPPRFELVERPDGYIVAKSMNGVESVRDALFITLSDMLARGGYDREFRERLQTVPLLVLDEVGGEINDNKGFAKGYLTQVLSARYYNQTKTIITTNLGWDDFRGLYGGDAGQRLVDRMRDGGRFFHVSETRSFRERNREP